jgi:hypothetical protein
MNAQVQSDYRDGKIGRRRRGFNTKLGFLWGGQGNTKLGRVTMIPVALSFLATILWWVGFVILVISRYSDYWLALLIPLAVTLPFVAYID